MKKIGLVVLSVLMVLLVSGCGAKTQKLSCKTQVEGVDITFNVGFKGNMIETMDFNYFYDLSKYTDAQVESIEKQDFCQTIKDSMPDYKDGFKSCEDHVNKESKTLTVDSVLDVDKIAKNTLDKMGTIESCKETLEAQGYTCTVQ